MLVSRVVAARRSEIVELPDPEPRPDELLVDVLACGICTSDHRPWQDHDGAAPVSLGHEIVGRVVAVGANSGRWREGDVVTGMGGGGYASRTILGAEQVLPVPPGIAPEHLIGEPLARLIEPLHRTQVRTADRVAIVGLGFMGLGLVQLVRAIGPALIVGVDPNPDARTAARTLGADEAYHPVELPLAYVDGGDPSRGDARFDVVIEAAGAQAALDTCSALIRPHGRLCVVGYHPYQGMHFTMDSTRRNIWHKGATLLGGFTPERGRLMAALAEGLELIAARGFSFVPLVTGTVGLEGVDEALGLMDARPPGFVKSVLVPGLR